MFLSSARTALKFNINTAAVISVTNANIPDDATDDADALRRMRTIIIVLLRFVVVAVVVVVDNSHASQQCAEITGACVLSGTRGMQRNATREILRRIYLRITCAAKIQHRTH